MAQQMRKFEQEAIAKEILDTIKVSNSKEQQAMEKCSKELKNIRITRFRWRPYTSKPEKK